MYIYVSDINESQSVCMHVWVYTYMHVCLNACVPSLLPCHCTYIWCHWTNIIVTLQIWPIQPLCYMDIKTQHDCIYVPKHNHLQNLLDMLLPCMGQQQICLSIYHIYELAYMLHYYFSINTSHELNAINNVTKLWYTYMPHYWHISLSKYASHITHIYPTALLWLSMYRSHIIGHTSQKKKKHNKLLLPMCQQQIYPSNAIYTPLMATGSCVDIRQLYQYIYLIWTQYNQQCDHKHSFCLHPIINILLFHCFKRINFLNHRQVSYIDWCHLW